MEGCTAPKTGKRQREISRMTGGEFLKQLCPEPPVQTTDQKALGEVFLGR